MHLNQLKSNSKAFYLAAERAAECRLNDDGTHQFLAVPTVVNLAFSIELGLKYLIHKQGSEIPRTHDLKELFNQLSDETKNRIANNSGVALSELEDLLEKHASIFQDWRYLHESEKYLQVGVRLKSLARSILKECR